MLMAEQSSNNHNHKITPTHLLTHKDTHTHINTHTQRPHLDLLLQEVDFVLLLQKLLLLPGNLGTERTTCY